LQLKKHFLIVQIFRILTLVISENNPICFERQKRKNQGKGWSFYSFFLTVSIDLFLALFFFAALVHRYLVWVNDGQGLALFLGDFPGFGAGPFSDEGAGALLPMGGNVGQL
jgi:hypothetical protein